MTRTDRNRFIPAAAAAVAMGFIAMGASASANQIAAKPDTAVFVAAADERLLARKIERALEQADAVVAKDITVKVSHGVVELTGTVGTPEEISAAQQIAYAHGALVVDNKLQIPAWSNGIDRPAIEE